jgi:hypothetical protein
MATNELQTIVDGQTVERVLLDGDLAKLTTVQRVAYYGKVCETLGFNPLTRPFEYITLNGKLQLYAKREATEQLRKLHKVSLTIVARELTEECYVVTARATLPDGRTDESIGVKSIANLKGEARSNALMTAETKAKRRVTLSICGMGMLDETEVDSLPPSVASYVVEPPPKSAKAKLKEKAAEPAPVQDPDPQTTTAFGSGLDYGVPAADDPVLPSGYVHVAKVEAHATKNENVTRYVVVLSSGESVTTINTWLSSLAEQYCQTRTPVRVKTKKTKWGDELTALMTSDEKDTRPEPLPLTDSDISF